jgi:hypothetical protein
VLTGSQQPPQSCNDFVFTGTVSNVAAGVWSMDSCACGQFCLVPDPYTLTLTVPDQALLPTQITCPKIEVRRDPNTCELLSIVFYDLSAENVPLWIGSREAAIPPNVGDLDIAPVNATACIDHDQYALEFMSDTATLTLSQGEVDLLEDEPSDWDVKNYASVLGDGNTNSYAWVMKR